MLERWRIRFTLSMALVGLSGAFGHAFAFQCDSSQALQELKKVSNLDPNKECGLLAQDPCTVIYKSGKPTSFCLVLFEQIKEAADEYEAELKKKCPELERVTALCANEDNEVEKRSCMQKAMRKTGIEGQNELSRKIGEQKDLLEKKLAFEARLRGLKEAYQRDKSRGANDPNDDFACGRFHPDHEQPVPDLDRQKYRCALGSPISTDNCQNVPKLDDLLKGLESRVRNFYGAIRGVQAWHRDQVKAMEAYNTRLETQKVGFKTPPVPGGESKNPSSDITGTGKPPQVPAAGGGQGAGGGGDSAASPMPAKDIADRKMEDQKSPSPSRPPGIGPVASQEGSSGEKKNSSGGAEARKDFGNANPNSDLAASVGVGTIGISGLGSGNMRGSANGSRAAASSSGGVIGGGAGNLAGGLKPCGGGRCPSGSEEVKQFAPSGSLGSSSLASLGSTSLEGSPFDSIFKTDEAQKTASPGMESLPGTQEFSAGDLGDMGLTTNLAAASQVGIGMSEGISLFERVRGEHVRAQRKGLVSGMKKKL